MTGNLPPEAEQRVDTVLRHGWDGDRLKARGIVDQYPDIGRENLCCAATVGDVGEVRRWLASDPTLANMTVGSLEWTPLTYVTYGRLDAQNATTIAGLLLEAGADPNFGFDDGWGSPFKVLTGAIGLGEGAKPTHPQAIELVEMLIKAGANPFDLQTLYNSSLGDDEIFWTDLLWRHSIGPGRSPANRAAQWSQKDGLAIGGKYKVGALNYLLGNSVGQNHLRRAAWLLDHGADASTVHAYSGQPVHTTARLAGFRDMVHLLEQHGAAPKY